MFTGVAHCGAGKRFVGVESGILAAVIEFFSTIVFLTVDIRPHSKTPQYCGELLVPGTNFVETAWNLSLENEKLPQPPYKFAVSVSHLNYFARQLLVTSFTLRESVHVSVGYYYQNAVGPP